MVPADPTLMAAPAPEPAGAATASADAAASAQERRLAAQMRALAEIAPAVAHDLRAPINAMVLNLEVLRETIVTGRAAEESGQTRLLRYAGVLRDELARLHRSLEVFLGHISPRSDRIENLDLRDLAGELAALLTAPARKRQIEVVATVPDGRVGITANPYLLRQALLHFGLAALAAVPQLGRLEVTLAADHGHARLRIAGAGRDHAAPPAAIATAVPPPTPPPLERLEVARSLLAAERGRARVCRAEAGAAAGGAERGVVAAGGTVPGFEIELPLADPQTR